MKIDDVDRAIMAEFQRDGRQSNREVARSLDVSEGTVRQRLNKLQRGGVVRFDVVTDAARMGIGFVAFLRAAVVPRHLEPFLDRCVELPDIWYVAALSGRFNAQALICTDTAATASDLVGEKLAKLEGVHEVEIRQVVRQKKHDFTEIVIPKN